MVAARRRRYLTLVSGSAPFVVPLTVGTLAFRAVGVGPPGIGNPAVLGRWVPLVVRAEGIGLRRECGLSEVGWRWVFFFSDREGWGLLWEATGRDQAYVPQGEPTFRKGGGAQGRVKNAGVPETGVGRVRFEEGGAGWWC